jgi:hypothetical protein
VSDETPEGESPMLCARCARGHGARLVRRCTALGCECWCQRDELRTTNTKVSQLMTLKTESAELRIRILEALEQGRLVTASQLTAFINAGHDIKFTSREVTAVLEVLVHRGDVGRATSSNGAVRYVHRGLKHRIPRGDATERVFAHAVSIRLTIHNPLTGDEHERKLDVASARRCFEQHSGVAMFELEPCKFAFLIGRGSPMRYARVTILTTPKGK